MALGTVANVSTGKPKTSGAVYYNSDMTKTLPTSATAALTDFKNLGYISEDGIENDDSRSIDSVLAWGGDAVHHYQSEHEDTFKLSLMEHNNPEVLKARYGKDNVTVGSDGKVESIKVNSKELDPAQWVFDIAVKGGFKRICIPNGVITETDSIVYKDDEVIVYGITISCEPDASGNKHYEYFA